MRSDRLLVFLAVLTLLALIPNLASAQYPFALLTISPGEVQLGDGINFEWICPSQLLSWQFLPMPFIYAQIRVNRVQEVPTSIPPYVSPPLNGYGRLTYTPPTSGTFTVTLECHYEGIPIGLGDFVCRDNACRSGGQFVVTPPPS